MALSGQHDAGPTEEGQRASAETATSMPEEGYLLYSVHEFTLSPPKLAMLSQAPRKKKKQTRNDTLGSKGMWQEES